MAAHQPATATQPVGFASALAACRERINHVRTINQAGPHLPAIALENFLVEIFPDRWFDLGLLVLDDPEQNIFLETFTQMTPIPLSVAVSLAADTAPDYAGRATGFSVPVGQVMAANLQVAHTAWHEKYTGTKRSDMIYVAAKTLANLYKGVLDGMDSAQVATAAAEPPPQADDKPEGEAKQ